MTIRSNITQSRRNHVCTEHSALCRYVVYMFDKRNYGFSSREKAMDEPATNNKPVSRSYLVIRDIGAVVDHIRAKHKVSRVTLIGWSWGAVDSTDGAESNR